MHYTFLNRHVRCHTGHKPYKYLKYEEKPYKCKVCEKAFIFLNSFKIIFKKAC